MKGLFERLSKFFMYVLNMLTGKEEGEAVPEARLEGAETESGRIERTHNTYKNSQAKEGADFRFKLPENGVLVGIRQKGDRVWPVIIPEALPEPDS